LLTEGYSVTGADIRPNPWSRKINELTIIADLCKTSDLEELPVDIDMVIHLAANARVYDLVLHPEQARENFEMLFNILEFCRKNTISGFLFSSSREVYGNSDNGTYSENDADIRNCENPYAASKIGGEALVYSYHQCYGIDFIITRFSNVYGMYDTSDRVIPLFIQRTRDDQDLIIYGKDKRLDFSFIDDTVAGIIRCIVKFTAVKNTTFNISSGRSVSILDVAYLVRKAMNGKNAIIIGENRAGEVMRSEVDISKAEELLGFVPEVSIEEGIERSIIWYREHGIP